MPIPTSSDVVGMTLENDIYFRPGVYDPGTPDGLALLGHELTHVGQYRQGTLTRFSYVRELIQHGSGENNKYEKPAYDTQRDIERDLKRKKDKCCPR